MSRTIWISRIPCGNVRKAPWAPITEHGSVSKKTFRQYYLATLDHVQVDRAWSTNVSRLAGDYHLLFTRSSQCAIRERDRKRHKKPLSQRCLTYAFPHIFSNLFIFSISAGTSACLGLMNSIMISRFKLIAGYGITALLVACQRRV